MTVASAYVMNSLLLETGVFPSDEIFTARRWCLP